MDQTYPPLSAVCSPELIATTQIGNRFNNSSKLILPAVSVLLCAAFARLSTYICDLELIPLISVCVTQLLRGPPGSLRTYYAWDHTITIELILLE